MGIAQSTSLASSFAARATRIAMSPTMKVTAEALALKARGIDVVDLGAGEPDFPTPRHIGAAAHAASVAAARAPQRAWRKVVAADAPAAAPAGPAAHSR